MSSVVAVNGVAETQMQVFEVRHWRKRFRRQSNAALCGITKECSCSRPMVLAALQLLAERKSAHSAELEEALAGVSIRERACFVQWVARSCRPNLGIVVDICSKVARDEELAGKVTV